MCYILEFDRSPQLMIFFDKEVRKGLRMLMFQYPLVRFCFLILGISFWVFSSCVVCVERGDSCQIKFSIHFTDKTTKECFEDFNTLIDKYGGGTSLCLYQLKDSVQLKKIGRCIENYRYSDENLCFELKYIPLELSSYSKRRTTYFIGTESSMGDTIHFVQNGTELEIFINGNLNQKLSYPCFDEKNAEKMHHVELYIEK